MKASELIYVIRLAFKLSKSFIGNYSLAQHCSFQSFDGPVQSCNNAISAALISSFVV